MSRFIKIEGFENYLVSDSGDVYSDNYNNTGTRQKLKHRKSQNGYLYVNLSKKGKYKSKRIHRLVAESFLDRNGTKKYVNHIDGNKLNNLLNNLEWCTLKENSKHAYRLGLCKPPPPKTVLSESDVINIRSKIKNGIKMSAIAIKYNVSYGTIKSIKYRNSWKHI